MKQTGNKTQNELVLRFGANRVCAWRICGDAACLRARACRGDAVRCADLMHGWLEAIEEEQRARRNLAALEDGLDTMEEVRAYRAWRKALHRAKTEEAHDPAETARIREELARMIRGLQQTPDYERRERELRVANGEGT